MLKAVAIFESGGGGGSGTVTQINTGTGLTGGPITTTGTVSVANSTANTLAGFDNSGVFSDVAIGTNLTLSGGVLNATGGGSAPGGVQYDVQLNDGAGGFSGSNNLNFQNGYLTINGDSGYGQLQWLNTPLTGGYAGSGISGTDNEIITGALAGDMTFWSSQAMNFSADTGNTNMLRIADDGVITAESNLYYNPTLGNFGIQNNNPGASGDFKSALVQTIPTPASIASATDLEMDVVPTGDTLMFVDPAVAGANNIVPTEIDIGTGNYNENGSTYDYQIIPYTGTVGIDAVYSAAINGGSFTDANTGMSFNISIAWNQSAGAFDGILVGQQINGGGFLYFDAGNITSPAFDNAPVYSAIPVAPQSPDFVANGTTYSYYYFTNGISPSGNPYWNSAPGDNQTIIDNNDGLPFQISHLNSTQDVVIFNANFGTYSSQISAGTPFVENAINFTGSIPSPTGYGYPPDFTGATPNYYRSTAYILLPGSNRYYSTPSAWSSPNFDDAGSRWYSAVFWTTVPSATGYIVEHSADGVSVDRNITTNSPAPFYDDALTTWNAGAASLTPTSYLPPALLAERDNGSFNDVATVVIQSLNPNTPSPTIDFQDFYGNSLTRIGYDFTTNSFTVTNGATIEGSLSTQTLIVANSSVFNGNVNFAEVGATINIADGIGVNIGTSSGTKWGTGTNNKQAWFAATPVVQQTGDIAAALTTYGLITSPTLNVASITGTLGVSKGGTGQTTGVSGGIPYYSSTTSITSSALLVNHALMVGGGAGAAPATLGSLGTTTTVLHGNAAGNPTFGAVSLTADISGILPVANGGTGSSTALGIPLIVGNARQTGLTAARALTTLTVGGADTTYLVSANVNITAVTVASFQVTCTYTDETNTSRTLVLNFSQINGTYVQTLTAALGTGAYEGAPLQIRAKAGTTIIIASAAGGTYTSITYNLEERIMQL